MIVISNQAFDNAMKQIKEKAGNVTFCLGLS